MYISRRNFIVISILLTIYILVDGFIFLFPSVEFLFILFVQVVTIGLSISPVGSAILRLVYGVRKMQVEKDLDKIMIQFNDVYEAVKEKYPHVNKNIRLCTDNSLEINAYTFGNSITVTRGSLEFLNEEELHALIAHEFAHIVHGDNLIFSVCTVGNFMLFGVYLFLKMFEVIALFFDSILTDKVSHYLAVILQLFNKLIMSFILFVINAILLINQRKNEYDADAFACECGYCEEMKQLLYHLRAVNLTHNETLLEKIKSSHPYIDDRIARL